MVDAGPQSMYKEKMRVLPLEETHSTNRLMTSGIQLK